MADHNELGKLGEEIAAQFLVHKGYHILDRNWVFKKGELDIVAQHNNTLIIIEVKTRNSAFFGDPQEFVTPSKIKMLVKTANAYILEHQLALEARFDIIAVLKNKKTQHIEHIENAFYHF